VSRAFHFVAKSKKRLALFGVAVALVSGGGGAFAYSTATGSGTASAQVAGTTGNVTLSAGTPSSALYPGGSGDVALQISNPNSSSVHLPSLVLDTSQGTNGFAVDGSHSGCDVSTLSFTPQDNGGSGFDVPAGSSTLDLTNAISMGTSAASACQGASFTVYLKVGP
jgi:hypothetical protein